MAQPLAKPDQAISGGIDAAAVRLEQAFARLESALAKARTGFTSLKVDHEKLNLLLQAADKEIVKLKEVTGTVSRRLDKTIAQLELLG